MKLRVTVAYEYNLPDDEEFLLAEYGTAVPEEIAEINRASNEAVDMIVSMDRLDMLGNTLVSQVQYTIVPVPGGPPVEAPVLTLEDQILGPVDA